MRLPGYFWRWKPSFRLGTRATILHRQKTLQIRWGVWLWSIVIPGTRKERGI